MNRQSVHVHPGRVCPRFTPEGSCEIIDAELGWDSQVSYKACEACLARGGWTSDSAHRHARLPQVRRVLLTVSKSLPMQTPDVQSAFVYRHLSVEERVHAGYPSEYVPGYFDAVKPPPEIEHVIGYARHNPCGVAQLLRRVGADKLARAVPGLRDALEWDARRVRLLMASTPSVPMPSRRALSAKCPKC